MIFFREYKKVYAQKVEGIWKVGDQSSLARFKFALISRCNPLLI